MIQPQPTRLRTVFADYPHTIPLKRGDIKSGTIAFDFIETKPVSKAFKPMVREQAFDVSELALVTFLQAKAYDKPLIMLPAVLMGRFQHGCMLYNSDRNTLSPADLAGRRIGVRSYAQTTGAWLRGILENDYGVDFSRVHWVTFEDAHVAEYRDPPGVERAGAGKDMTTMLLDGEIDAAIYGADMPKQPQLKSIIPDPDAAALAWYEKYKVVPVNHLAVVTASAAKANPGLIDEIYRLLLAGKKFAGLAGSKAIDTIPFGIEANRPAIEMMVSYALQQGLIPRRMTLEEIFGETMRLT